MPRRKIPMPKQIISHLSDEKVYIVCDRPYKLLLDQKNYLHAEEGYALEFPGNYGVYAYRGVTKKIK
ncbi:DUF6745 domain-containing protein [Crocosphaera chwakensis]|uniref:Leucyl aminopeptidase n=1 Tax=Crocosphaera chwakensis CCY0110 TaxID=391612 RepID=A3IQB5_9CHRO|nr:hypothetical protein [Crocosphaera chwakensis]EAZ91455.1 leucyl aminopeptidase [Crocosphaera chwakensis CCY0110]